MQPNLFITCGIAFVAVLMLLSLLAVMIRLLTSWFPDDSPEADGALMKAIEDAVVQAYPGATVVSVELEEKD
jgi:hypothetical protein